MESDLPGAPKRPPPQPATPRVARRPRWGRIGMGFLVVAAFLLGCGLFLRSLLPRSTVVVRNVADRALHGVVVLAVAEGSADVRREWRIGTLRPGEAREVELGFVPDTNLAIRLLPAEGSVLEDRVRIYLGAGSKQTIDVDVASDGVKQAHVRRAGYGGYEEEIPFSRGLAPR